MALCKQSVEAKHYFTLPRLPCLPTILLVLISFAVPDNSWSSSATDTSLSLTISQVITLVKKNNPLVELGRLEVETARQKSAEIAGKFLSPQMTLESTGGLVPAAEGDVTYSPDSNDGYNDLGPFARIDLKITQPLYTFGKYSAATGASQLNLEMQEALQQEAIDELTFTATKAFLGMIAGRESAEVGKNLQEHYTKLLRQIEKMLQDNDPEINDSHLLEIRAMSFEITKQSSRGRIDKEQAALLLKGLLNLTQNTVIHAVSPKIPDFQEPVTFLPKCLAYASSHSRQLKSLDAGIRALHLKAELEENMKYPDIFLLAGAGYGSASNRDEQDNPFVSDEYNYDYAGAVLGMKWDFNYQVNTAKKNQACIDWQKLQEKRKLAALQLDGEIRDSFLQAERQWNLFKAAKESLQAAQAWIRLEGDNLDMGLGDVKRLVSAYRQYFQLKADEIETRYLYLLALARLAKTMGNIDLYLQWEKNAQVQID